MQVTDKITQVNYDYYINRTDTNTMKTFTI
ncbi:hypothetical protein VP424E501_P0142 [Vibrio phage 424E50-1]|nr:hypothetical protein VP424E501_P0142 [Vibrio phage 424E50-1]